MEDIFGQEFGEYVTTYVYHIVKWHNIVRRHGFLRNLTYDTPYAMLEEKMRIHGITYDDAGAYSTVSELAQHIRLLFGTIRSSLR